jgi:hypothetical protein
MDPFMMGLLSLFASGNPMQAGPMMDAMGVPLPGSGGGDPGAGGLGQLIPGEMGPFQAGTSANTAAQVPAQPQTPGLFSGMTDPKNLAALAGMQGVKAPAEVKPIMSGGVTGGVKAPEANASAVKGATASPALQSLMAALLSSQQDPLRVPQLGALMRR